MAAILYFSDADLRWLDKVLRNEFDQPNDSPVLAAEYGRELLDRARRMNRDEVADQMAADLPYPATPKNKTI